MGNHSEHVFINGTETKQCARCCGYLPLKHFSQDRSRWDGLQRYCKNCAKIYDYSWYKRKKYEKRSGNMAKSYKERRKAKEKLLPHNFTKQDWTDVLRFFDHRCAYCGTKFTRHNRPTKEHVLPVHKGGPKERWNIVPVCGKCNASKNGYDLEWWWRQQESYDENRLHKVYRWISMNYFREDDTEVLA